MDLREAIIHTRQVADGCGVDSRDCAYQHDKLGDWLEELQEYRSIFSIEELRSKKIGKWKNVYLSNPSSFVGTCSICGVSNDIPPPVSAHYCPNCGAKMEEE